MEAIKMKNNLLRKNLVIGVVICFIGAGFLINVSGKNNLMETKKDKRIISNDQIDQQQTLWNGAAIGVHYPDLAAQSFKPSLNTITRIQIIACRDGNPSGIITLSIRSSLDGEDIVSASINAEDLEPDSWPIKTWVEFDFGEMPVTPEETYYFVWSNQASEDDGYAILAYYENDVYTRGCSWLYASEHDIWYSELYDIMDFCFITYGFNEERADLNCEGSLSWNEVSCGSTIEGSFTVENIGSPGTLLDWEISEWPDWGEWTFTPESMEDLTPEDGAVTVDVEVVAPDDPETEFTGEIKVVNSENPYDYCIIDVFLATPVSQPIQQSLFQKVFERFPNAFPILRHLYGLSL